MKTNKELRHGFTLIELLVVIAIIAVLAAILVPAVTSALDRARTITCLSQIRQLSIGFFGYSLDHDDMLPESDFGGGTVQWAGLIIPYLGDEYDGFNAGTSISRRQIFFCPVALGDHAGVPETSHGSYGVSGQTNGKSVSEIEDPIHRFLLSDGHWNGSWWNGFTFYFPTAAPDPVHNGAEAANFAFVDGHVGTVDELAYLETKSHWVLDLPPRYE